MLSDGYWRVIEFGMISTKEKYVRYSISCPYSILGTTVLLYVETFHYELEIPGRPSYVGKHLPYVRYTYRKFDIAMHRNLRYDIQHQRTHISYIIQGSPSWCHWLETPRVSQVEKRGHQAFLHDDGRRFDDVWLIANIGREDVVTIASSLVNTTHEHKHKSTVAVTEARASSAGAVVPLLLHSCCAAVVVVKSCIPWLRGNLKIRAGLGLCPPAQAACK